jgi:hypothetical protein
MTPRANFIEHGVGPPSGEQMAGRRGAAQFLREANTDRATQAMRRSYAELVSAALTAALIGLGGVVGAAIIAAFAAIFGPSLLHRLQRRAKYVDDAAVKNEAAIRRLVEFRTTGRSWLDALEIVAGDFGAGRAIGLDAFDNLMGPLRDGAVRSVYEMAFDSQWVQSAPVDTGKLHKLLDEGSVLDDGSVLDTDARRAKSEVLHCLRRATKLLRDDVRANQDNEKERISSETWEAIEDARRARAELNTTILAQIEKMTRR